MAQEYSILILSPTPSKTPSFVDAVNQYVRRTNSTTASPPFSPQESPTHTTTFHTDLPTYSVKATYLRRDGSKMGNSVFQDMSLLYHLDKDLSATDSKNHSSRIQNSTHSSATKLELFANGAVAAPSPFHFLESDKHNPTPRDILALVGTREIHLALVVVPPGDLSSSVIEAVQSSSALSPLLANAAFLHTGFDYTHLTPAGSNTTSGRALRTKQELLDKYLGRKGAPHFFLGSVLDDAQPFRTCIGLNTIRRILGLSRFNPPASMAHALVPKAHIMVELDEYLMNKHKSAMEVTQQTIESRQSKQSKYLSELLSLEKKESELVGSIAALDTPELKLVYEERTEDEAVEKLTMPRLDFALDTVKVLRENVSIIDEVGGEGHHDFSLTFQDEGPFWVLHAKAYAKKSAINRRRIDALKEDLFNVKGQKLRLQELWHTRARDISDEDNEKDSLQEDLLELYTRTSKAFRRSHVMVERTGRKEIAMGIGLEMQKLCSSSGALLAKASTLEAMYSKMIASEMDHYQATLDAAFESRRSESVQKELDRAQRLKDKLRITDNAMHIPSGFHIGSVCLPTVDSVDAEFYRGPEKGGSGQGH